jgi:HrpA-like RNA helicase
MSSQIRVRDMFSNTERTLATALDPPAADQVGNSIRNLQHLGALTIVGDQYKMGELLITSMGLFMCEMPIDIFLTRYIVTTCMLGCAIEGITIAAILS